MARIKYSPGAVCHRLIGLLVVLSIAASTGCAVRERGARAANSSPSHAATCFFDGEVCVLVGDEKSTILGFAEDEVWWIDVRPLSNLESNATATLSTRKRAEDAKIYGSRTHAFAAEVEACCGGDVVRFLQASAEKANFAGSLWQHLTAVGGWARTRGAIAPTAWISADPLVGTAGNGPDFVFPGVALIGGDIPGSATTRIAVAHDIDWSLGRYLGIGPLAPFLFPQRFGGGAPDTYSTALGLAGLGTVICDPFEIAMPDRDDRSEREQAEARGCDWYIFTTDAFGGDYARPFEDHPDWQVYAANSRVVGDRREACVDEEDSQRCWCASASDATGARRIAVGPCDAH